MSHVSSPDPPPGDPPDGGDRSVLDRPGPAPDRARRYGPEPHQVYETHLPPGGRAAARAWVVLVHGGFWRAQWDRTHLRPLAGDLADEGYAVTLVEYARSGMPGGGWPTTGSDVVAAVRAVLREEVDDTRGGAESGEGRAPEVVLVGHSAGGHLAVWALHQPELSGPGSAALRGAVSLAGCLDLHLAHELALDDHAARDLMGQDPADDPAGWAGADPARLGRTPYPVVVVHGDADEQVPLEISRSWWQRSATPGRDRLVVLPGQTHFPLIDPGSPAYPALLDAVGELLAHG